MSPEALRRHIDSEFCRGTCTAPEAFRSTFPKTTFCIRGCSGYIPRQTNVVISVVVIAIWPWVVA